VLTVDATLIFTHWLPRAKPDINYALVFRGVGTIVKIIAVQILAAAYGIAAV